MTPMSRRLASSKNRSAGAGERFEDDLDRFDFRVLDGFQRFLDAFDADTAVGDLHLGLQPR